MSRMKFRELKKKEKEKPPNQNKKQVQVTQQLSSRTQVQRVFSHSLLPSPLLFLPWNLLDSSFLLVHLRLICISAVSQNHILNLLISHFSFSVLHPIFPSVLHTFQLTCYNLDPKHTLPQLCLLPLLWAACLHSSWAIELVHLSLISGEAACRVYASRARRRRNHSSKQSPLSPMFSVSPMSAVWDRAKESR